MLDKEIFKKQMLKLMDIYPTWKINYEESRVMRAWYECFEHMEDKHFSDMVRKYIQSETMNPTVAGLLRYQVSYEPPISSEEKEKAKKLVEELLRGGEYHGS